MKSKIQPPTLVRTIVNALLHVLYALCQLEPDHRKSAHQIAFKVNIKTTIAIAIISISHAASAALIDKSTYTLDTTTSLEWLDINKTSGLSYNQILADAGGWTSAGWRYASTGEVRSLLSTYVSSAEGLFQPSAGLNGIEFFKLFSATWTTKTISNTDLSRIYALYDDSSTAGFYMVGRADLQLHELTPGTPESSGWQMSDNFEVPHSGNVSMGSFLVRTAAATYAVPEPETYTMLLAGLGLLGTIARRKKFILAS